MPTICPSSPIPDYTQLHAAFTGLVTPDIPSFTLPPLPPTLPSFSNIGAPSIQMSMAATDAMSSQLIGTMFATISPLISYLGMPESVIPKVPVLNVPITELLTGNQLALKDAVKLNLPALQSFMPVVPVGYTIPDIQVQHSLSYVVRNYQPSIITFIIDLIKSVTDDLELPNISGIPSIPTLPDITNMIVSMSGFPSINELMLNLNSIDLSALFGSLSFTGFPSFSMPAIVMPTLGIPELGFNELMLNYMSMLATVPLDKIIQFVTSTLSMLGFTFPIMCVNCAVS